MYSIEAKIRTESAREARKSGVVPGVLYGKDTPSTMIAVGVSDFTRLFRGAGQNHIVALHVGKDKYDTLIHDIQRHPVSGAALHIDFLTVDMKSEIEVEIPVKLIGTSQAVLEGGELHQYIDAVAVRCLPKDIVDAFEFDISAITEIGTTLPLSDLKIDSKKYEVLANLESGFVGVHAIKEIEEEAPVVAEAAATPEAGAE